MEVTIHSTLSAVPGRVVVPTSQGDTIDSLIIAFAVQKGVPHRRDYVLRDENQEMLQNSWTLQACEIKNGDLLYLGLRAPSEQWLFGCNQWWLLAGVALMIGGCGIIAVSFIKVNGTSHPFKYGVVLDAGSSHTSLYIYRWPGEKENGTAVARQFSDACTIDNGITFYENNPSQAGPSLQPCLDEAATKIPASHYSTTPIYLGATAGMRLLQESNNAACQAILESVRDTMEKSYFSFQDREQARIITGAEEGTFSWVTANYLSKNFADFETKKVKRTLGALDLGGASTQNTFIPAQPKEIPSEYREEVTLYGWPYVTYTHSYLCYGTNEAIRQMMAHLVKEQNTTNVTNPCAPSGNITVRTYEDIFEVPCTKQKADLYQSVNIEPNTSFEFHGSSDPEECKKAVATIFNFSQTCDYETCSFNGVYQPPVYGDFVAFSGFYNSISFLNLTKSNFTLEEFRQKTEEFCKKTWDEVKDIPIKNEMFLVVNCFDAIYIDTLLTQGYKFDNTTWGTLSFKPDIGSTDLGWSLGYMLNSSNTLPQELPTEMISDAIFGILVALFIVFLAISVCLACYAKSSKKRLKYRKLHDYGSVNDP